MTEPCFEETKADHYEGTAGAGAGFGSCTSYETSSDANLAAALAALEQFDFRQSASKQLAEKLAAEEDAAFAARMAAEDENHLVAERLAAEFAARQHT